jgi:hypothetical protein
MIYNIFQDMRLVRDFGFHAKEINNLYYINNNSDARDFGQSWMARNNMNLFNATFQIQGRPNLRVGLPVYFKPRDTIYYIREISHEFSVGGQFTTNITAVGGRRIMTGFLSQKQITNYQAVIVQDPNNPGSKKTILAIPGKEGTDPEVTQQLEKLYGQGTELSTQSQLNVNHYILSDGWTAESFAEQQLAGNPTRAQISEEAFDTWVENYIVSNPEASEYNGEQLEQIYKEDPNNIIDTNLFNVDTPIKILREVFVIMYHPNQALIGLIVDKESNAISAINVANFNYFAKLGTDNIPDNVFGMGIKIIDKNQYVAKIKFYFNKFINNNGINSPNQFTSDARDQFIRETLRDMENDLKKTNTADSTASNNGEKQIIANSALVFNFLVSNVDNNGYYKQLTDSGGRELPAYQNFGFSLLMDNTTTTANTFNSMAASSLSNSTFQKNYNKKSSEKGNIGNARALTGTQDPNSEAFTRAIANYFTSYNIISPEVSGTKT